MFNFHNVPKFNVKIIMKFKAQKHAGIQMFRGTQERWFAESCVRTQIQNMRLTSLTLSSLQVDKFAVNTKDGPFHINSYHYIVDC